MSKAAWIVVALVVGLIVGYAVLALQQRKAHEFYRDYAGILIYPKDNTCKARVVPRRLKSLATHAVIWQFVDVCSPPNAARKVTVGNWKRGGHILNPDQIPVVDESEGSDEVRKRVKPNANPGVYTYEIAIDGQRLANQEPEFEVCPEWPCWKDKTTN